MIIIQLIIKEILLFFLLLKKPCFSLLFKNIFDIIPKGDNMSSIVKRIFDYSLEEIMGERFSRYSKTIIQDRALPDVRDGLKPVQRRILFGMYKGKHTYDKPYVKSARCVGDVMGKYHPHGDSSIYDAMVRMSQWWKQNEILIDMQGNNGSMDGDSAAAMRYTETRLSKISGELINKDIDKGTVKLTNNFDDTELEPTVLPAKYPNLLVNGASGISAGYATNIPPHNLGEIIDATIKRIDSPNCRLDTILEIVKGPDFPTGATVLGKKGIVDAFTTGRGKVVIRAKYEVVKTKGKPQIIVTEIPFDVNKENIIRKIDDIRLDKKIDGIVEARNESDREFAVRLVIDLKKDANVDLIINYLLKNTDLQISYNYNTVAIVNKRPHTLGIIPILDAYINFKKEVVTKKTKFDLAHAEERMHIIDGLMKAISILDEVIATIRKSKNKADAVINLVKEYDFTERQADAIVSLRLYRLTNTDITELLEEQKNLTIIINRLKEILNDEDKLKQYMKEELKAIKKEYATSRKTVIEEEFEEIKIETSELIPKEDVIVCITNEGYVKRVTLRSYNKEEDTILKEGDYLIGLYELNTLDTVLLFTDKGNYLYVPVHEIPDLKWKELGKHISNIISLSPGENIVYSLPVTDFEEDKEITIFTKNGMVKRSSLMDFKLVRYSKPVTSIKLKEKDKVISITDSKCDEVFIATKRGFGLRYNKEEIPVTGLKAAGVKAISLKEDEVVSAHIFSEDMGCLSVVTDKNTLKRIKLIDIEKTSRARKGSRIIRDVKTNPYYIKRTFILLKDNTLTIKEENDTYIIKASDMPITDKSSVGSSLNYQITDVYITSKLKSREEKEEIIEESKDKEEILSLVDEKIYTIEDFLDDFIID